MFTPSSIIGATFFVDGLQVLHDAPAENAPLFEVMVQHFAHQALGLGGRFGVGHGVGGQPEQRRAADARIARARLPHTACAKRSRPEAEVVMVARSGIDGGAGVGVVRQRQRVAQLRQQPQLEAPQHRALLRGRRRRAQRGQRVVVVAEQRRVGVFARQQLQQQFVQIESAQQRRAARKRQAATPFRLEQRLELAGPRPRQRDRLERLQQAARLGPRPLGAARHHRHATVSGGERLDDQAGFAVRVGVQHERRLVVSPFHGLARGHARLAPAR